MWARNFCSVGLLMLILISVNGCVRIDIGDNLAEPTLGAQLVDLDIALQQGAMNLVEFKRARSKLLGF